MSRTDAATSSDASRAIVSLTMRVADRILFVSSRRLRTSSIDGSVGARRPAAPTGAMASRTRLRLPAWSGVTRKVSGSGLEPSSW